MANTDQFLLYPENPRKRVWDEYYTSIIIPWGPAAGMAGLVCIKDLCIEGSITYEPVFNHSKEQALCRLARDFWSVSKETFLIRSLRETFSHIPLKDLFKPFSNKVSTNVKLGLQHFEYKSFGRNICWMLKYVNNFCGAHSLIAAIWLIPLHRRSSPHCFGAHLVLYTIRLSPPVAATLRKPCLSS